MSSPSEKENQVLQSDKLPACPPILSALSKLMEDPDSTASDLAQAISENEALASRVLQVVNSSYYGLSKPVTSVEHAAFRLGVRELWSLASAVGILNILKDAEGVLPPGGESLWGHSLRVAVLARNLAGRFNAQAAEEFFAAGAMHDIGKLALFCFDADAYARTHKDGTKFGPCAIEKEIEEMGVGHAKIGGLLLRQWTVPEHVADLVAHLHQPKTADGVNPELAILTAADALAHAATREVEDQASGLIRIDYSDNLLTKEVADVLRLDAAECIVITTEAMQIYEELLGGLR